MFEKSFQNFNSIAENRSDLFDVNSTFISQTVYNLIPLCVSIFHPKLLLLFYACRHQIFLCQPASVSAENVDVMLKYIAHRKDYQIYVKQKLG